MAVVRSFGNTTQAACIEKIPCYDCAFTTMRRSAFSSRRVLVIPVLLGSTVSPAAELKALSEWFLPDPFGGIIAADRQGAEWLARVNVKAARGGYVLAPVRNSLGHIAGLVEVVSRLEPDARENVK